MCTAGVVDGSSSNLATRVRNADVRFQGQSAKHILALSFSGFDPEPTSQPNVYAIFRARPFPISDEYDIISAAVGSTSEGDARGLAGLRIAETSSQIATIIGGWVPGE